MKTIKLLSIIVIAFAAIGMAGCQKMDAGNSTSNSSNKAAANSNSAANTTSNTPANTAASSDAAVAFSLATPTDAYKTAYDCRKRKDIECLKKVMSQDIQDFLKMMGEDDKKSLDDMLKDLCERPQAPTSESRNEKITGDTATLEYLAEDGKWQSMDFEKVGSDWKMGAPKGGPGGPKSDGPPKKP